MTWAVFAALGIGSAPVYLYKIEKNNEAAYYTSRHAKYSAAPATMDINFFEADDFFDSIDFFAQDFSPLPIAHSRIVESNAARKKIVTISLPRTDVFAQKFIGDLGGVTTKVSIWQGFENDVTDREFIQMFTGSVQVVKPAWGAVSLVCEDGGGYGKGKGLAEVIQRPCRHALYFGKCQLNLADFQDAGSASAMVSNVITVAEAAAKSDGYYSGGIVEYSGSMQLIVSHTGTSLKVLGQVGSLSQDITDSGAQSVLISAGCDRSMATCDQTFNNSANFGGFEHLTESPFDGRSIT